MFDRYGHPLGYVEIASMLAWGLGYFGQPHILVRFMAIRSNNELPLARAIAMRWLTWSLLAAVSVGILGSLCNEFNFTGGDVENIFIVMANGVCTTFWANVVILGVLATIMSTTSSQLLVAASSFSNDIYSIAVNKNASQKKLMFVSKASVLIVSIISIALAMEQNRLILDIVAYAWAGFGACLGPALLFSLFFRRTTEKGVLCGIVTGGICVLTWEKFAPLICEKFDFLVAHNFSTLYEIVPAFFLSSAVILVVSLLDREPSENVLRRFDSAKRISKIKTPQKIY
jgi:sodium/proline symporter